ncbi:DUF397 domain-containing protein [Nocardiopsis deserti]|uniref:DUF397 domain-containing protein n=1 Tax=Nocardiopsis deserti TaxID=2605988 RepID=UPI00123C6EA9|nr:DUF397 domain-containing protein [Nocardiopsis deserti]
MHQTIPVTGWFKSSYSASQGDCVEVAHAPASFRKSSYSGTSSNCVKVADSPSFSAVRDTQNRDMGALTFGPTEWHAFLSTTTADVR